jgi:hypothetical protein
MDYRADFQPLHLRVPWSWGAAPGWYESGLRPFNPDLVCSKVR